MASAKSGGNNGGVKMAAKMNRNGAIKRHGVKRHHGISKSNGVNAAAASMSNGEIVNNQYQLIWQPKAGNQHWLALASRFASRAKSAQRRSAA